jgi:hypothetical protein
VFLLGDITNGGTLLNIPGKKSRQEFIVEYMTVSNGRYVNSGWIRIRDMGLFYKR